MSNLSRFLAKNKIKRENGKYAPSKAFVDENGKPLEFEFRPITSKRNETMREGHTKDVPVVGKPNMFRPKLDTTAYINDLIAESIVEPDLYNKELQDSYCKDTGRTSVCHDRQPGRIPGPFCMGSEVPGI